MLVLFTVQPSAAPVVPLEPRLFKGYNTLNTPELLLYSSLANIFINRINEYNETDAEFGENSFPSNNFIGQNTANVPSHFFTSYSSEVFFSRTYDNFPVLAFTTQPSDIFIGRYGTTPENYTFLKPNTRTLYFAQRTFSAIKSNPQGYTFNFSYPTAKIFYGRDNTVEAGNPVNYQFN